MTDVLEIARERRRRLLEAARKLDAFIAFGEDLLTSAQAEAPEAADLPDPWSRVGNEPENDTVVRPEAFTDRIDGEIADARSANS